MAGNRQRGVIEISEDAHKQNEVYRPWKDIVSGETRRNAVSPDPFAALPPLLAPRDTRRVG